MCGRFTITLPANELEESLGVKTLPKDYLPRYNVAPSQPILVVTNAEQRNAEWMRWGLIPSWAKDPAIGYKMINARSETLTEKPSYRNAFARRRCLILADGFYEWQKGTGPKGRSQPYYFKREDGRPFAFAGLWEFWQSGKGEEILSCTIITCSANETVQPVHERMPVMLDEGQIWQWLQQGSTVDLQAMLQPFPAHQMVRYPVSNLVNRPEVETPDLILPTAI